MHSLNFLSTITGSFAQPAAENPTVAMVDVIPNPPVTRLVRDAAARGCRSSGRSDRFL